MKMKNAIRSRANLKKVFISLANHPHPRPPPSRGRELKGALPHHRGKDLKASLTQRGEKIFHS
jgi:hypothetical protein